MKPILFLLAAVIMMAAVITLTVSGTVMAAGKPLKVYIMAGQSNMQGSAHLSTFNAIGDDPATSSLLSMVLDKNGCLEKGRLQR